MKKTTVGLCCALAALSSFGNVLLNPGFEKLSAKSYPENWSRNAGKIVKFNGSNAFESARIISEELEYSEDNTESIKTEFLF